MSIRWVYGFNELDLASERCGGDWDEVRGASLEARERT